MIRRPPRSTLDRSSAASDVYKRQIQSFALRIYLDVPGGVGGAQAAQGDRVGMAQLGQLAGGGQAMPCLLYPSPNPRDRTRSRMPSSA